ncbi:hypothetical protein ACFU5O_19450 [Streptomyces sp. NPDC057445]|uniref:hypothetical protein n=1 Tax=Streptomyces sp. NPDC057445 TaxID=3346136 RepID=UPI0036BCF0CA
MFRRTFWFTAGAAAGVWATTKVNRKLRQLTPESLAAQAANRAIETGHRLKDFALDVRAGMVQREAELGEALGIEAPADGTRNELPGQRRPAALDARAENHKQDEKHYGMLDSKHSYNRNEDH